MDEHKNILVEEYFDQDTSEERKRELRSEILKLDADDPDRILLELGEEVVIQRKAQQLASKIEHIGLERRSNWLYLKVAASVVIVFLSVLAIYQNIDSIKAEQELFETYFQPYPDLISVRLPGDDGASWQKALVEYQAGKYEESLSLFEKADPPQSFQEDVTFYHAMTLIALGKSEAAVVLLQKLGTGKYEQQARWYLALAYLQNSETEKAIETLQKIQENNFQWVEAQELLKEIN